MYPWILAISIFVTRSSSITFGSCNTSSSSTSSSSSSTSSSSCSCLPLLLMRFSSGSFNCNSIAIDLTPPFSERMCKGVLSSSFTKFVSAFASINNFTIFTKPPIQASCNGVLPLLHAMLTSAPCLIYRRTKSI